VVELPKTTGDIRVEGMYVDKVRTIVSLETDTSVEVAGFTCEKALETCKMGTGCSLTIDGEEVSNG